jgi:mannose-1-phosphate guanylyltransferase/mannose-6-phosphate isomerase
LGERTLLQQTILRLSGTVPPQGLWIVTSKEQQHLVHGQLAALVTLPPGEAHVLAEPLGRNTAAAIGLAAVHLRRLDPEAVMAVLPADHWIERQDTFAHLLQEAVALAERNEIVTLGVVPHCAETGYGYIKRGRPVSSAQGREHGHEVYHVERFAEKPSLPTAQDYVRSGCYYWNAGIFVLRAATILEEFAAYLPELSAGLARIADSLDGGDSEATLAQVYQGLESVSLDHGVLEKSDRLVVIPADIGWSDLGEWATIHQLLPHDEHGNTFSAHVVDIGSENTLVRGGRRPVATIGLKNIVAIDTEDALLICAKERAQEVKTVVQQLQTRGAEVIVSPHTVQRPWGSYTVLEEGIGFKVKRITVHAGASLSLQLHHHRSEHWVVVQGIARVTNGDREFSVPANHPTSIPVGTKHRLANPGPEPLEIIEVQRGTYLGEDDIVRFADLYGRVSPVVRA